MKAYHVSPVKNRLAIRRYGLIPRDTTRHNFVGYAWDNTNVEAVFVNERLEDAVAWRAQNYREVFGPHYSTDAAQTADIWEVELAGLMLSVDTDPYATWHRDAGSGMATARRVHRRVESVRLRLLSNGEVYARTGMEAARAAPAKKLEAAIVASWAAAA